MKRCRAKSYVAEFEFGFPFEPYEIQIQFMRKAYQLFSSGGFGLFESPTGTGKSLSLICSALTWLEENEEHLLAKQLQKDEAPAASLKQADGSDLKAPAWILESFNKINQSRVEDWMELHSKRIENRRKKAEEHRERLNNSSTAIQSVGNSLVNCSSSATKNKKLSSGKAPFYETKDLIMEQDSDSMKSFQKPQIFICSRTQSQLAQYVEEIKKTKFASTASVVCLGSRQHLCVNSAIRKQAIRPSYLNELCRLANEKGKCSYRGNASVITDLALSEPTQIEQLVKFGSTKTLNSCPYFGLREAAKEADVLLLPYNCVLSENTLTHLNLNVTGNVIIFDEAHNLMAAINTAGSAIVTLSQLHQCKIDLEAYIQKFQTRMNSENFFLIRQLERFCSIIEIKLQEQTKDEALNSSNFLVRWHLDTFDLQQINYWLSNSGICQKVRGFSEHFATSEVQPNSGIQRQDFSKGSTDYPYSELS
ncbi:putative helicase [Cardiosporidium cionae]|uniref:Helicase n=1 Tax=Cardiosporidium cionae TaxID=476202 RepID=A0ABQ7JF55_9APIC|nr:putative helicase [Cardiosporidium cionae]|eukprot:KAF8822603.1 putative helicase [Cardiosporidium cionae]